MKGKVIVSLGSESQRLANLHKLTIRDGGKLWVYDPVGSTEKELRFKRAPMSSGNDGLGGYLKQWRKRNKLRQAAAAKLLGVSQSMISKMEIGERELPPKIYLRIRQFNKAAFGEEQRRKS